MIGGAWHLRFLREDDGATMAEYALVAVLIAAVAATAVVVVGAAANALFERPALRNAVSADLSCPAAAEPICRIV